MIPPGKVVQDNDHDSASDKVPLTESALGDSQAGGSPEYSEALNCISQGLTKTCRKPCQPGLPLLSTASQITPRKLKSKYLKNVPMPSQFQARCEADDLKEPCSHRPNGR
jgi:hypothetical protein